MFLIGRGGEVSWERDVREYLKYAVESFGLMLEQVDHHHMIHIIILDYITQHPTQQLYKILPAPTTPKMTYKGQNIMYRVKLSS